ncbi:hypothetical protein ACFFU4_13900, partial [Roseovarius ramblicola]
ALGTAQDPVTPGTSQALDTPAPGDPAQPGTPGTGPATFDTALGTAQDPVTPGTSQALDTPVPGDPAQPGTPGTGGIAFGPAPDPLAPGTSQALATPVPGDPAQPGTPGTGGIAFGPAPDPLAPGTSQALDTPAPGDPAQPGTPGTGGIAFGPAPDPLAPGTSQALDTPAPGDPASARHTDLARHAFAGLGIKTGPLLATRGAEVLNRSALRASVPQNARDPGARDDHVRLITGFGPVALHGYILNSRAIRAPSPLRIGTRTAHDRLASFALAGLGLGVGSSSAMPHHQGHDRGADGGFSPQHGIGAPVLAGSAGYRVADSATRYNSFHDNAIIGITHRPRPSYDGGTAVIAYSGLRGHGTSTWAGRVTRAGYFR